jgi:hypothetical protein
MDYTVFFHCIGTHLLIKLTAEPTCTGWCVLGFWLSIYSLKVPLFSTTASRLSWNEQQVLRMYSATSWSHSATGQMQGSQICVRHHLDFSL